MNGQHGQHEILPSMLLQATRNPEHLSMSRDSNCTKKIWLGWMDKAVRKRLVQKRRRNGPRSSDGFGLTCTQHE
jgi:hypothetical protein